MQLYIHAAARTMNMVSRDSKGIETRGGLACGLGLEVEFGLVSRVIEPVTWLLLIRV